MKVVDAHMHLCNFQQIRYPWLDNPANDWLLGEYRPLAKRLSVAEFLANAEDVEITKMVHIENGAAPSDRIAESRWIQSVADESPSEGRPNAIIAGVDLTEPNVERELALHAECSRVRGVRQILNVHRNPYFDFIGRDPMSDPLWRAGFTLLKKFSFSFDLQIYPSQMHQAAKLAAEQDETTLILNHTGMFVDRNEVRGWRAWRDGMRELASHQNIAVKISGMGMLDHNWTIESIRPYVLETIDTFGVRRCMFASNFPVDGLYSSYSALWHAFEGCVFDMKETEKDCLFRLNAERIYRI